MNTFRTSKYGYSLIEVSGAVVITVLALGLSLTGFMYVIKNTYAGDAQHDLDIKVQIAMERLKQDMLLSSLDEVYYYPPGPGPYTAISFPLARDDDGDGLFELDADGNIIWDETLIYHVWHSSPHQLKVTTFNPRDNTLNDAQRQEQLNRVVKTGSASLTYNSRNASSDIIFENLLNLTIKPNNSVFDAYSPKLERQSANLGFVLIPPGSHTFNFKVLGKNNQSSGYHIGLDQLFVSPSYGAREAEAQLPVHAQNGAVAINKYMPGGSWKGNHQLYFPATDVDQNFSINLDNDRWEETNFGGLGYVEEDTTVDFDQTLTPKDFVVRLAGMDKTWEAEKQANSNGTDPTTNMNNWAVRILQKGSELADGGNWFTYNGEQCRLTFEASSTEPFKVLNVFIGESATNATENMDYLSWSSAKPVKFNNGSYNTEIPAGENRTSDWVDLEIDKDKNYLVSFRIANDTGKDAPKRWYDERAVTDGTPLTTLVVENAGRAIAKDKTWSDLGAEGIVPYYSDHIIGLKGIEVTYPDQGTYTSHIFDTQLAAPVYQDISWNADIPADTSLSMKVRTGNDPYMADAPEWENVSASSANPHYMGVSSKRYVQFQAHFESDSDGMNTPLLKDVTIDWDGEKRMVDMGALITKGPNQGIFEVTMDGQPLLSALTVELEIYKDMFNLNTATKRITSSQWIELRPRNTGR